MLEDNENMISNSISNQRVLINEYIAKCQDLNLIDYYIDDGYSGTSFNRPAFKRLLEDIRGKKVNAIIVKDLSRFGRNHIEVDNYIENIFPVLNVRFISIIDGFDSLKNLDITHDLEFLKYQASLNVLIDLSQQGWVFNIKDSKLYLKMENDNIDDKAKMRYRLSAERNAQFKQKSIAEFIKRLEAPHEYNGEMISIKNLIGDKEHLINSIKNHDVICSPYVQLVKEEKDEYTGFKLSEIWRYFRFMRT